MARPPRPQPEVICRPLSEADAATLDRHARERGGKDGLAVLLGLYLGLRRSEIARVRWRDLTDGWLTITGKGDKEVRLPVHPVVLAAIDALPREDETWLFPGLREGPVKPATVWSWIRLVATEAGLRPVPPHRRSWYGAPPARPLREVGGGEG